MEYLHQESIYYGDMKESNLLIFRNQKVKLGDFGISVKLDPDDEDDSERKYYAKGHTRGYITNKY